MRSSTQDPVTYAACYYSPDPFCQPSLERDLGCKSYKVDMGDRRDTADESGISPGFVFSTKSGSATTSRLASPHGLTPV